MHGFYGNEGFVMKEFSVCYFDSKSKTRTFLPPYSWDCLSEKDKYTNNWVTKNMHWEGTIPYSDLKLELYELIGRYSWETVSVAGPSQKNY
ncbi:hypothetical protein PR048_018404 [Dryococelus australis]|uniref:Uncharacterized protein n=1 Tax=Dryococelus australis TaxID=614101 RepID=A0ABQ9HCX2_9NEOP|nr:hypothetical protein PR048_018404 [Dryococelus australis]